MRAVESSVGIRIRRFRLEKNMTQDQLAAKIGGDRTSLSSYVHSKRMPDIFVLCRMADIFEVSLDDLVGRKF